MPDWFDSNAPGTPAPAAPTSWWERVKATRLADLPRAVIQDAPDLLRRASEPLYEGPTRAAKVVSDWVGQLEHGGGGPERRLIEGAGETLSGMTSRLSLALMGAGEAGGPLVNALGRATRPAARTLEEAVAGWQAPPVAAAADPVAVGWKELAPPRGQTPITTAPAPPARLPTPYDRAAAAIGQHVEGLDPFPAVGRTAEDVLREHPLLQQMTSRVPRTMPADTGEPMTPFSDETATARQLPLDVAPEPPPASAESRSLNELLSSEADRMVTTRDVPAAAPTASDLTLADDWFLQHAPRAAGQADLPPAPAIDITEPGPLDEVWKLLRGETPRETPGATPADVPIQPEPLPLEPMAESGAGPAAAPAPRPYYEEPSPFTDAGKRRLSADEFLRTRALEATNLGEPVDLPAVPSAKDLPWRQRKVAQENEANFQRLIDDEAGFVDPQAMAEGFDALTRQAPGAIERYRRSAMLSSPSTWGVNIVGDVFGPHLRALEDLIAGNPRQAGRILTSFWSRDTVRKAVEAFHAPAEAGGKFGAAEAPTGWRDMVRRILEAPDVAARDALERADLSEVEANRTVWRGDPLSTTGANLTRTTEQTPLLRLLGPFPRFASNFLEANLQRVPGSYLLPGVRDVAAKEGAPSAQMLARQILGAGATAGGYALAQHERADRAAGHPTISGQRGLASRLSMAALASLSLPASIGMSAAIRHEKPRKPGETFVDRAIGELDPSAPGSAAQTILRATPLLSDTVPTPGQYLGSLVPGLVRDLSPVEPSAFDPNRPKFPQVPKLLGPAISRIPFLNELLLYRKPHPAAAPTLGSTVADWFSQNAPQ